MKIFRYILVPMSNPEDANAADVEVINPEAPGEAEEGDGFERNLFDLNEWQENEVVSVVFFIYSSVVTFQDVID